jgi:hypothetical protein
MELSQSPAEDGLGLPEDQNKQSLMFRTQPNVAYSLYVLIVVLTLAASVGGFFIDNLYRDKAFATADVYMLALVAVSLNAERAGFPAAASEMPLWGLLCLGFVVASVVLLGNVRSEQAPKVRPGKTLVM